MFFKFSINKIHSGHRITYPIINLIGVIVNDDSIAANTLGPGLFQYNENPPTYNGIIRKIFISVLIKVTITMEIITPNNEYLFLLNI